MGGMTSPGQMGDEPPRICNGERYDTEEGQIVARIKRKVRANRREKGQPTQTVAAMPSKNTEHTRGGRTYTYIWADCRALVGGLSVCRACWPAKKNISKKNRNKIKKITEGSDREFSSSNFQCRPTPVAHNHEHIPYSNKALPYRVPLVGGEEHIRG